MFEKAERWKQPLYVLDVMDSMEGMEWHTIKECMTYLEGLAILKKIEYWLTKNDGDWIRSKCVRDDCECFFMDMEARQRRTINFYGTKQDGLHSANCTNKLVSMNKHADSDWVYDKLTEIIKTHRKIFKPQNLRDEC